MRSAPLLAIVLSGGGAVGLAACLGADPTIVSEGPADGATSDAPSSPALDGEVADASSRFCESQVPASGVSDFLCADFDGTVLSEGFEARVPSSGELIRQTDLAYSPPASLVTTGEATLYWEKTGTASFSEMAVEFRVNVSDLTVAPPAASGHKVLVDLGSSDTNVRLAFVRGRAIDGQQHTGYFIQTWRCGDGGGCSSNAKRVETPLAASQWVQVRFVWKSTGAVELSFDGERVFDQTLHGSTSAKTSVAFGLTTTGEGPVMGRHAFDNLTISVKR
jgi:hypothetical protein